LLTHMPGDCSLLSQVHPD